MEVFKFIFYYTGIYNKNLVIYSSFTENGYDLVST